MDEFAEQSEQTAPDEPSAQADARVQAARSALEAAAGSSDPVALRDSLDELEDALRFARDSDEGNGVEGNGVEGSGAEDSGTEAPPVGGDDELTRG
ncbi:hypothetical protein [Streptacidiphilus sp. EB129]|uniref:hypothetical protein n=1 Tax=Streptacidiphilus sp. EB129 TaxID=3156262 RepID=UPI0035162B06